LSVSRADKVDIKGIIRSCCTEGQDGKCSLFFLSVFSGIDSPKPFSVLGHSVILDLNFLSPASNGSRMLPFYRYDKDGNRTDNITDWGLEQFLKQYNDDTITKQDIFNYVYAVLHNPAYKEKIASFKILSTVLEDDTIHEEIKFKELAMLYVAAFV